MIEFWVAKPWGEGVQKRNKDVVRGATRPKEGGMRGQGEDLG